jgi:hypothetical protein
MGMCEGRRINLAMAFFATLLLLYAVAPPITLTAAAPVRSTAFSILLEDPAFKEDSSRTGPQWESVVMLTRNLRKIQRLRNYYDHRGRPR